MGIREFGEWSIPDDSGRTNEQIHRPVLKILPDEGDVGNVEFLTAGSGNVPIRRLHGFRNGPAQ